MLDGVAFFAGLAFFDPSTVMPVLLKRLGAADWQVGSRFTASEAF